MVCLPDAERIVVPVLALHVAGRRRPELVAHVGALDLTFLDLTYAGLLACVDSALPDGAAHAVLAARAVLSSAVFLVTAEPARYAGTDLTVFDVNPGGPSA